MTCKSKAKVSQPVVNLKIECIKEKDMHLSLTSYARLKCTPPSHWGSSGQMQLPFPPHSSLQELAFQHFPGKVSIIEQLKISTCEVRKVNNIT